MAACRPQAFAAGPLCNSGALKKILDFRILFAIITAALADSFPRTSKQDATVQAVAFCFVGGCDPLPIPGWIGCSEMATFRQPPFVPVVAHRFLSHYLSFGVGVLGRLASAVVLHASKACLVACLLSTTALSHASHCSTHILHAAGTFARSGLGFRVRPGPQLSREPPKAANSLGMRLPFES
jgi:hypothetical protein